ncbi:hypothetical protein ScPMuIL_017157 [Solemya velum]
MFSKHKFLSVCNELLRKSTSINTKFLRNVQTNRCKTGTGNTSFTPRTHTCGELRLTDVGKQVHLCGWLQYQRMGGLFLILRDWEGMTQVVIPSSKVHKLDEISTTAYESVIEVTGTVSSRPTGQENQTMPTGSIEVTVDDLTILNTCQALPFELRDFHEVKESLRMEHRYLDLRTQRMQNNLRLRSKMVMKMREFLCNLHGFVDVETPTLFRRTPGGAKEFVVPSRHPGKFYSLPQSPQQFKQLLMVGGLDRYFQIARCYRDEGSKPDRQPEFTQVDIEMSFVDREGVIQLVEELVQFSWPEEKGEITTPFPRMTYKDAMRQYGVDKPDTRFDMRLKDVSDVLRGSNFKPFTDHLDDNSGSVQALRIPNGSRHMSNKDVDSLKQNASSLRDLNIVIMRFTEERQWKSGIIKHLSEKELEALELELGVCPNDLIFLVAGKSYDPHETLGKLRLDCAELLESKGKDIRDKENFNFLWVVDFPLFLPKEEGEGLESAHHPFTACHPQDRQLLYSDAEKVRSQHYDLVLNGNEIGGGSIRIHDAKLQRFVLEKILQENPSELEHLLTALDMGCPPHGGIALGLDRYVSLLCDAKSIRDVIAFPKSHDGKDPMSKAPATVSNEDLAQYHIKVNSPVT